MRVARWTLFACALVLMMAGGARAASIDEQPLKFGSPTATAPDATAPAATPVPTSGTRLVMGLAVVVVLILGLKWAGQRVLGQRGAARSTALVRVLGRTPLAPKQQVLVLQVGRRVLVVADSHGRMNALCEIAEPDEVALLIGTTKSSDEPEKARRFGSVLRRAAEPFGRELPGPANDSEEDDDRDPDRSDTPEVNGLLDRVREMRQQFKGA